MRLSANAGLAPSSVEVEPEAGRGSGVLRRTDHRALSLLHAVTDAQSLFLADADPDSVLRSLLERIVEATGSTLGILGLPTDGASGSQLRSTIVVGSAGPQLLLAEPHMLRAWRENGDVVVTGAPGTSAGGSTACPLVALPVRAGSRTIGVLCVGGFVEADAAGVRQDLKALATTFASLVVAHRNLGQKRALEAELRAQEQRHSLLVEGAGDGVWVWEVGSEAVYCSDSTRASLGYGLEELGSSSGFWLDLLHPEDRETTLAKVLEYAQNERPFALDVRLRSKGGDYMWFRSVGQARWVDGAGVLRVAASLTDVTSKRLTDQRLREGQSRTATQHEVTKILSRAETVTQAAQHVLAALGTRLSWDFAALWLVPRFGNALACASWWSRDPEGFPATVRAAQETTFPPGVGVLGGVWKSGGAWWTDVFAEDAMPRRAAAARKEGLVTGLACPVVVHGETVGVIEMFSTQRLPRDEDLLDVVRTVGSQLGQLIERKTAEDALRVAKEAAEQASRAKTEFLTNVSHEIRTPLNAILGAADLLWESELDDEQRRYLTLFRRAGANLLALVNDLLDLSRVEAGQLELKNVAFDLREVVAQALESTGVTAYEKGLEMASRVSPDVSDTLVGDSARLAQVLVNLLSNAVKFTNEGEVVLEVERDPGVAEPGALLFSVRDTGIGIAADKREAIFDRFSQVDASPTRAHGGTGLGLAICRELVGMMGGQIWAESELGAGTTFRFTARFDVAGDGASRPAWTSSSTAVQAQRGPLRALVADDHRTTRQLVAEVLREGGHVASELATGAELRALLESADPAAAPFDVLIVDARLEMPGGGTVAEWLERTPDHASRCLLLLPGDARPHEMTEVKSRGFAGYILKPALAHRIAGAVALACKSSAREGEAPARSLAASGHVRSLDILLVEDHPDNRLIVTSYLKGLPYRVTTAESGEAAVLAFESGAFHLVLMDMQMPVMDGYEATRRIRAFEREHGRRPTPIVALTAHVLREEIERTRRCGCDAHLGKPISKTALLAAIERHAASATPEDDALLARIDPDLADLVPGYIQNRLRDVTACRAHLEHGRFEEIRVLAHGMAGSGGAYGFDEITRIGRTLQLAARDVDGPVCSRCVDELEAYVRRIHSACCR